MPGGRKSKNRHGQKPRPAGRRLCVQVNESLNAFITLRLGKEAFEDLLKTSTPDFLRWIARNTLLAIHAEEIRRRFPRVNSDVDASGESSDEFELELEVERGGESEIISSSAAATLPLTYAGPPDNSTGNQVSHSFHHLFLRMFMVINKSFPFPSKSNGSSSRSATKAEPEIESIQHQSI